MTLNERKNVGWVVACFPVGVQSETQHSPKFIRACKDKGFWFLYNESNRRALGLRLVKYQVLVSG